MAWLFLLANTLQYVRKSKQVFSDRLSALDLLSQLYKRQFIDMVMVYNVIHA